MPEEQESPKPIRCCHCEAELHVKTLVRRMPTAAGPMLAVLAFCQACYKPIPMTLLPEVQQRPTNRIASPAGLVIPQ